MDFQRLLVFTRPFACDQAAEDATQDIDLLHLQAGAGKHTAQPVHQLARMRRIQKTGFGNGAFEMIVKMAESL